MAWYDFFTDVGQSAANFWDSATSIFDSSNQYSMEEDEIVDDEGYYYIPELQEDTSSSSPTFAEMAERDEIEGAWNYILNEDGSDGSEEETSSFLKDIESLIEKGKSIAPLAKAAKGILEAGGIGGKRGSQAPSTSRRGSPTAPSAREQRMKEAGRVAGSLTASSGRGTSAAQMFARQNKVDVSEILASLTDPKASGPNIKLIVGNKLNVSRTA